MLRHVSKMYFLVEWNTKKVWFIKSSLALCVFSCDTLNLFSCVACFLSHRWDHRFGVKKLIIFWWALHIIKENPKLSCEVIHRHVRDEKSMRKAIIALQRTWVLRIPCKLLWITNCLMKSNSHQVRLNTLILQKKISYTNKINEAGKCAKALCLISHTGQPITNDLLDKQKYLRHNRTRFLNFKNIVERTKSRSLSHIV